MPPVKHNANAARPSGWISPGDHQAWSIRSVLAPDGDRRSVREPEVARRAHGVGCRSRNAVFGPHRVVLLESTRGQQDAATRPDRPPLALALHHATDDAAVVDDQLDEAGVQMSRDGGIVGHRPEEAADDAPARR